MSEICDISMFPETVEKSMDVVGPQFRSKNICIFAFSQSAVSAGIVSAFADIYSDIAVTVITDGRIPAWISAEIDVMIISCCNDERALSVYEKLKERKCRIHCITSNEKLLSECGKNAYRLPAELSSITSCGFILGILASFVQRIGICNVKDALRDVMPTVKSDRDKLMKIDADTFSYLKSGSISFYGTADIGPVLRRFTYDSHEILKRRAFNGELPEFDHNELVGWCMATENIDDLKIVILRSETDPVMSEIVNSVIKILGEYGREPYVIDIPHGDVLEKNIYGIMLADIVCSRLSGGAE